MSDSIRTALEVALEALEGAQGNINPERGFADEVEAEVSAAIDQVRAALAQQPVVAAQGPVAFIRASDLARLADPRVRGCAASLDREARDGFVAIYSGLPTAEQPDTDRTAN